MHGGGCASPTRLFLLPDIDTHHRTTTVMPLSQRVITEWFKDAYGGDAVRVH